MSNSKLGTFSKECRIKKYEDFQAVFKNGQFFYNDVIKIGLLENESDCHHLGLVVSKRHGNAPHRNRIKRLFREVFRLRRNELKNSLEVVIIPRFTVKDWSLQKCDEAFRNLVKKYNGSLDIGS